MTLYVANNRPDAMRSAKTIAQHASKLNILMEARLHRLSRHLEGHLNPWRRHELQDERLEIQGDGGSDWAAPQENLRRSTSGGTIRHGKHLWDAYNTTQATSALSSGEAEFYATGSTRGLMAKNFLEDAGRRVILVIASDSSAGRGMRQRAGVGRVRHLENRFLWIRDRIRQRQLRLIKESTDKMVCLPSMLRRRR